MPTDVLTVCPAPTETTWVIQSEGCLQGKMSIPGDKSISHRALMLGALASGETTIQGLLLGEDPRSTAHCFRALGAEISELNTEHVRVQGIGLGRLLEPNVVLDAGNSGTTLRLMLGIHSSHPLQMRWKLWLPTGSAKTPERSARRPRALRRTRARDGFGVS